MVSKPPEDTTDQISAHGWATSFAEVAAYIMVRSHLYHFRLLLEAYRLGLEAPLTEAASFWRINRTGDVSCQQDPVLSGSGGGLRHSGNQRLGIGMGMGAHQLIVGNDLHHLAQIHHQDPVTDIPHHSQVMADKNIGQVPLLFQGVEEIEDLSLYRNIQSGYRFITKQQPGLGGQSPAMRIRCRCPPENSWG